MAVEKSIWAGFYFLALFRVFSLNLPHQTPSSRYNQGQQEVLTKWVKLNTIKVQQDVPPQFPWLLPLFMTQPKKSIIYWALPLFKESYWCTPIRPKLYNVKYPHFIMNLLYYSPLSFLKEYIHIHSLTTAQNALRFFLGINWDSNFEYTRPKPAYGRQGLDWDRWARIQFSQVHFGAKLDSNQPKTTKNHENTLKNHGNQPKP